MSTYQHIQVPDGDKIETAADGSLNTPDKPIIAFIEGSRQREGACQPFLRP